MIITTDQDQTTTSDWALYDVPTQLVTVGGNVVLMQGKNVLKGDRLVIDLKTGESRFENQGDTATKGRIRALFVPKQDAKSGESKSDGQAGGGRQVARRRVAASPPRLRPRPLLRLRTERRCRSCRRRSSEFAFLDATLTVGGPN